MRIQNKFQPSVSHVVTLFLQIRHIHFTGQLLNASKKKRKGKKKCFEDSILQLLKRFPKHITSNPLNGASDLLTVFGVIPGATCNVPV